MGFCVFFVHIKYICEAHMSPDCFSPGLLPQGLRSTLDTGSLTPLSLILSAADEALHTSKARLNHLIQPVSVWHSEQKQFLASPTAYVVYTLGICQ